MYVFSSVRAMMSSSIGIGTSDYTIKNTHVFTIFVSIDGSTPGGFDLGCDADTGTLVQAFFGFALSSAHFCGIAGGFLPLDSG